MENTEKTSYVDELIKSNLQKKAEKVFYNFEKDLEKLLLQYFEYGVHVEYGYKCSENKYLKELGQKFRSVTTGDKDLKKQVLDYFYKKEEEGFVEAMKIMQDYTQREG